LILQGWGMVPFGRIKVHEMFMNPDPVGVGHEQ